MAVCNGSGTFLGVENLGAASGVGVFQFWGDISARSCVHLPGGQVSSTHQQTRGTYTHSKHTLLQVCWREGEREVAENLSSHLLPGFFVCFPSDRMMKTTTINQNSKQSIYFHFEKSKRPDQPPITPGAPRESKESSSASADHKMY